MPPGIPSEQSGTTSQGDGIYTLGSQQLSQSGSRLPDGFHLDNGIVKPAVDTLAHSDIPEGYQDIGGIITPIKKPEERIAIAGEEEIQSYATQEQSPLSEKLREDIFLFSTLPWRYFDKKLKESGVHSPVPEIEKIIEKEKPLDVADLEYNEWNKPKEVGEVPEEFRTFLEDSADILINDTVRDREFVNKYFGGVNMLIESQIYANRCYKLKDAKPLEKVLTAFKEANVPLPEKVCDFISYFEIPPSIVKYINENIEPGSRHALKYYTDSLVQGGEQEIENVGIEIEGFPKVTLGRNSYPGFRMGIDGGGTIPELRRETEKIKYDLKYKKDLYDLWYWAKMSRLMGLSLHVHLDDEDGEAMENFTEVFGRDSDSVRRSRPSDIATVQIRLNLPFYPEEDQYGNSMPKTTSIFDPQIYVLQPLIDELMVVKNAKKIDALDNGLKIGKTADGEKILGENLASWWRKGFTVVRPEQEPDEETFFRESVSSSESEETREMSAQEALDILRNSSSGEYYERYLEIMGEIKIEEFTPEVALEIFEKLGYGQFVTGYALKTMDKGYVTQEFIRQILEKSTSYKPDLVTEVLGGIDENLLTVEFSREILSSLNSSEEQAIVVAERIKQELLTREFALELISLGEYSQNLTEAIFRRINKKVVDKDFVEQVLGSAPDSWDTYRLALGIVSGIDPSVLTTDISDLLLSKIEDSGDDLMGIMVLRMKKELLTPELARKYIEASRRPTVMANALIENMDPKYLTRDFLENVILDNERIDLSTNRLIDIVEQIAEEALDDDFAYKLFEKSIDYPSVLHALIERKGGSFISGENFVKLLDAQGEEIGSRSFSILLNAMDTTFITAESIRLMKKKFDYSFDDYIARLEKKIFTQEILKELLSDEERGRFNTRDIALMLQGMSEKFTDREFAEKIIKNYGNLVKVVVENTDPSLFSQDFINMLIQNSQEKGETVLGIISSVDAEVLNEGFIKEMLEISEWSYSFARIVVERVKPEVLNKSFIADLLLWGEGDSEVIEGIIEKMDKDLLTQDFAKLILVASESKSDTSKVLIQNMRAEEVDEEFVRTLARFINGRSRVLSFTEAIPEETWTPELLWSLLDKLKRNSNHPEEIFERINKGFMNAELLKGIEEWFGENTNVSPYVLKTLLGDSFWIKVDYEANEDLEMESRDPQKYLGAVFNWAEEHRSWNSRDFWVWEIHEGGIVNMKLTELPPTKFVDRSENLNLGKTLKGGRGITNLISELAGHRILSINSNGRWFLKIVP